jgi:PTS system ascorbate-specific IIC component
MPRITGTDEIGIGHYVTIGYALSGWLGSKIGDASKSTESLKLPKGLSFFRDYVASISLTMIIFYYIAALAAGKSVTTELADGMHWLVFPAIQGLTFAAAVYAIITGVRMFLGEIVPAFLGISEKLIPGVKPALDCPAVFPYAPTAVILGFLTAYATGLAMMGLYIALGWTVIIPVAIPYFFIGGTAGVFGNSTGGWKGAVAGSAVVGILISLGPQLIYPIMAKVGLEGSSFPETDFSAVGWPLYKLLDMGAGVGTAATFVIVALITALVFIIDKREKATKPLACDTGAA